MSESVSTAKSSAKAKTKTSGYNSKPDELFMNQAKKHLEKNYENYRHKFIYHIDNVLRFRINKHAENGDIIDSKFLKITVEKDGVVVEDATIRDGGIKRDLNEYSSY